MNAMRIDAKKIYTALCTGMVLLAIAAPPASAQALMENYCNVPPYVTRDVPPNIMIMMDNSADMMNQAYADAYTPNAEKDNYIGYFKPTGCYSAGTNKFEEQLNILVVPNRTYAANEPCPTTAPFRGNLMNWATMSKFDVLQKVIIGGNTASKQGNAHTLVSIGASWTKSYGGCDFSVLNGNLTISETPSGSGCALLDTSLPPIASAAGPARAARTGGARAGTAPDAAFGSKTESDGSLITRAAKKLMTAALWLWDNISIVSVAEAAACNVPAVNVTGTVGQPVSLTLTGSDVSGSPNYTWSMTTVPSFFSGVTPLLTGTKNRTATWTSLPASPPNSTGVYNYTVTVQRGTNCGPTTVSGTITIGCASTVDIQSTTALPNGSPGTPYSFTMTGINGVVPYAWSATGLTPGLSIDPTTGKISGSPTVCGNYSPRIRVTDSSPGTCTASFEKDFTLNITTGLQIVQNALSPAVIGQFYSFTMTGSGGVGGYTWSATGLPAELTITAGGWISGTITDPTADASSPYPVVIALTDTSGCTITKNFSLQVSATPLGLQITTISLPSAIRAQAYSYQVQGAGGTGLGYTWSAIGLPGTLVIDAATGMISGTAPNATGSYSVTITLRDSSGTNVSKPYTLQVIRAVASQTFSIKVDLIEETLTDLNGNDIFDPGTGETFVDANGNGVWEGKSGVFQKYWNAISPKARWGLTAYTKQGEVNLPNSGCIPAGPASSFYTAIQNVQPSNNFPIAAGLYGDMNYYGNSTVKFPYYDSASYKGCTNSDPIDDVKCRRNFVLIISSGADLTGPAFTTNPDGTSFSTANCLVKNEKQNHNLVKNACYGFTNDMRADKTGKQTVLTYAINTMGTAAAGLVLEDAALAGGGKYYDARNISMLEAQLEEAFKDMLGRAASGTAASVLASGEGSGANLIQAVYYPRKKFGVDEIDWTGRLTNLWYFVDPNLQNSNIREDAGVDNGDGTFGAGDKVLTLKTEASKNDNIVQLYFDTTAEVTKARRWKDTDGNTVVDAQLPDIEFESIGKLWEAGGLLWSRDLSTSPRSIYTTLGSGRINFSTANKTTLRPYLQAGDDNESEAIIRYTHGEDTPFSSPAIAGFTPDYRPRKVRIGGAGPFTWKLGDILNSTPKISSWLPLNLYHKLFFDSTYGVPGADPSLQSAADGSHYITSTGYRARNMIFAGANDGMLHAFKLGTLELKWTGMGDYDRARLTGAGLGEEAWAFIPKHALPYLKYTAALDYCHVYTVDLTPFIFDASIGTPAGCTETDTANCDKRVASWRTVLIGGMRYGGSCKPYNTTCATTTPNGVCAPATEASGASVGYSSYFALDITDQNNPIVLWEFADPQLGFSTAGPALLRVSAKVAGNPVPSKNGHWFVVLASGPTGPITSNQFLATSDQQLRLFVLDLRDGTLLRTIDTFWNGASLPGNAFAGSMLNSALDTDLDYQDDVLYIPYVKQASDGTWGGTDGGGVLRLATKEDTNPVNWAVSTLMDGIGPVASSVSKLQNKTTRTLWTYFGTGRYYYALDGVADDAENRRKIFGVKDPCFSSTTGLFDPTCTTSRTVASLINVTDGANVQTNPDTATGYNGWYINLDADYMNGSITPVPDPTVRAERVITDPVAATSGVVFFTTYKPFSDQCAFGGTSAIWAVKYNSGGDASSLLKGQALIQVSTGSIEQLNLSEAFKDTVTGLNTGNRKSASIKGVPPTAQGLSILSTPAPTKKVLHIKER